MTAPMVPVNLGIELAHDNVFIGRISGAERLLMGADVPLSYTGAPARTRCGPGRDTCLHAEDRQGCELLSP